MLIYKDSKPNYKKENIERKIVKNTLNNQFFKPIIVSIDDMDRFEKKEMKKIRPIKNSCNDSLIDYIP